MTKGENRVEKELALGADISIIAIVGALVEHAHELRASDIHIDPTPKALRVRLRIDGVLHESFSFPKSIHGEIISRIKVLAGLRSDEHQATQDGRFRHPLPESVESVDIRVSIAPTYHGENAVLRLLSDKAENFTLERLGFNAPDRAKILHAIEKPNGMILATGPTGSGKTTTLYTLVKMLNSPEISIVTIEDPIEYAVANVKQIGVNPRTDLTFAKGLRSILRQDPDIIMVGEIRDRETAQIAINTALTGHLLLSTLHTNDAATTLPRLLDMGIDAYLVASTMNVAIAQRLVRKICEQCNGKGKSCFACGETGFRGRISINEVLVADEEIREAILSRASASELKKIAVKNGMTTMQEDGLQKVKNGVTTMEEILRVVRE
ncbi:GspE/PulE family protein [bacterium]|nr:GspE/PulE family protein [bacterium]